ncbi:MAG: hypothetical protein OXH75_29115 [Acidobacteria bacterium]|nr:hypothetical protein [Acidobacteriota bacterium]
MKAVEDRVWPEWRAAVEVTAVFLLTYLPGLGRGFIKDDFAWIAANQVTSAGELLGLFTSTADFYRPVVRLSFAADWWLFGIEPLAYGLTNLAVLAAGALALRALALALGMPRGAALLAAGLWAFNFHGVDMSLLWISGRTSLLATLFALLAARSFVVDRPRAAAGWALLAMLSKEDAVLLPFVLLAWGGLWQAHASGVGGTASARFQLGRALRSSWPLFVSLAVYLAARTAAGAMTPLDAPAAYRFVLSPGPVILNALSYLDRGATLAASFVLLLAAAAWIVPRPSAEQRRWVLLGLVWMLGGYALAVFLPVRSSLYAVGPAAGASLAGAALVTALWDGGGRAARCRAVLAGAFALAIAVPIHWARLDEWVDSARLSTRVLDRLAPVVATLPPEGVIRLDDDRGRRINLDAVFGTLVETAVLVRTGRRQPVWIEPPPIDWRLAGLVRPHEEDVAVRFALRDDELVRLPEPP